MTIFFTTFATPAGDFSLAVNDAGQLLAAGFGALDALPREFHANQSADEAASVAAARQQVEEYFAGERQEFDLELAPAGSEFQRRVWLALRQIPFGETRSYGDLARQLGSSARAIGRANATNPIAVIVPCHRVIGADGTLTGYAGGLPMKQWLLEHEQGLSPAFV
jgi:methylated-DNA-[protein]-cysteine S-methyltransferase